MNLFWLPEMAIKSKTELKNCVEHRDQAFFLGIRVNLKTMSELIDVVADIIKNRQKAVIANHNLHSLYLFQRESLLKAFYSRVEWCHIDGMPLVALAWLFGHKAKRNHRITYIDWMDPLMERAARQKWRIFYLGSAPGVAERGADLLRRKHANLQIRTAHGYFSVEPNSEASSQVIRSIKEYEPQILLVGMGMPRQEFWIHQNRKALAVNVILPCGAAMDYVAGAVLTPPRWVGRAGLEWAFRLLSEPTRLWQRYLVEPWSLVVPVLREFVKSRFSVSKVS